MEEKEELKCTKEIPRVEEEIETDKATKVIPIIEDSLINSEPKKNVFEKIKDYIKIMLVVFKNRNLAKLDIPREERVGDNSGYYASLVSRDNYFDE